MRGANRTISLHRTAAANTGMENQRQAFKRRASHVDAKAKKAQDSSCTPAIQCTTVKAMGLAAKRPQAGRNERRGYEYQKNNTVRLEHCFVNLSTTDIETDNAKVKVGTTQKETSCWEYMWIWFLKIVLLE